MAKDPSAPATQGDLTLLRTDLHALGEKLTSVIHANFAYWMNSVGKDYARLEKKIGTLEEKVDDLQKGMDLHFETLASHIDIKYEKDIVTLQNRTSALEKWTGVPVP